MLDGWPPRARRVAWTGAGVALLPLALIQAGAALALLPLAMAEAAVELALGTIPDTIQYVDDEGGE